jgi:hypothetical protein
MRLKMTDRRKITLNEFDNFQEIQSGMGLIEAIVQPLPPATKRWEEVPEVVTTKKAFEKKVIENKQSEHSLPKP